MPIGFPTHKFELHATICSELQSRVVRYIACEFIATNDTYRFQAMFLPCSSDCGNMIGESAAKSQQSALPKLHGFGDIVFEFAVFVP